MKKGRIRTLSGTTVILLAAATALFVGVSLFVLLAWITPASPAIVAARGATSIHLRAGNVRYETIGSGARAVLLLHGFNGQLGDWNQTWDLLGDCPARRIRIDLPGFGLSTSSKSDYSLGAQARTVIEFLDALGVEKVVVIGGSMGGSLAAWLAAHYPDRVESLGLLAPSGYTGALRYPGMYGLILKPGPFNRGATVIARSRLYQRLFPRSKALQALTVTASYGPAWVGSLPRIRAPTTIVWSSGDEGVSFTTALDVQRHISGSQLLWIDRASGHLIPKTRPELTARLACLLGAGTAQAAILPGLQSLLRPDDRPPAG
jgi:pyruvate dehydrogenase E2 component (dihydrolipoamide acetyltransferase)